MVIPEGSEVEADLKGPSTNEERMTTNATTDDSRQTLRCVGTDGTFRNNCIVVPRPRHQNYVPRKMLPPSHPATDELAGQKETQIEREARTAPMKTTEWPRRATTKLEDFIGMARAAGKKAASHWGWGRAQSPVQERGACDNDRNNQRPPAKTAMRRNRWNVSQQLHSHAPAATPKLRPSQQILSLCG